MTLGEALTDAAVEVDPAAVATEVGTTSRNVRRGLSLTAVGAAVNVPVSLLTVPLVLHRLTLVTYGVFATLTSVLSIIGLVEAGVGTEVVRRVAGFHGSGEREALKRSVREGTSVLLGLGIVTLACGAVDGFALPDVVFGSLPQDLRNDVPWVTLIVTAGFSADLMLSGWFATLAGLQRSDWASGGGLIGVLLGALTTVVLVLAGAGIWSLAVGSVVQVGSSALIRAVGMRRLTPDVSFTLTRVGPREARAYASTSAIVLIATVANIIDFQFDKILLANIVGAAAAGSYQIGASLALQVRSLALLPVGVLLPGTSELGEGPQLVRLRRAVTQLNTAASLILVGGLVAFAPMFVRLWLGSSYSTSAFAAQILGVALLFNAITGPWYTHCVAVGLFRIPLYSALANAVVNATVSWTLIAAIGFDGAVYGSLAGNIAGAGCFAVLLLRASPLGWLRGLAAPAMTVTAAAAVVLWIARQLPASWPVLLVSGAGWAVVMAVVFLRLGWVPLVITRTGFRVSAQPKTE